MTAHLRAVAEYVSAYDTWAEADESLNTSLATVSKLQSSLHGDYESMVNISHKLLHSKYYTIADIYNNHRHIINMSYYMPMIIIKVINKAYKSSKF